MTNHWTISCCISSEMSICLNAQPSGLRMTLLLMLETQQCAYSNQAVKAVQLQTQNLTVNRIINEVMEAGRDRYQFTPAGNGCRYWISGLIDLLMHNAYLLDQQQVEDATKALTQVWNPDGALVPPKEQTPMSQGQFY
jgi:hypothetical protein